MNQPQKVAGILYGAPFSSLVDLLTGLELPSQELPPLLLNEKTLLHGLKACRSGVDDFLRIYPDGITPTWEGVRKLLLNPSYDAEATMNELDFIFDRAYLTKTSSQDYMNESNGLYYYFTSDRYGLNKIRARSIACFVMLVTGVKSGDYHILKSARRN